MSKQRIRIVNPRGAKFTTPTSAIEMIAAGTARYIDEHAIELVEEAWREKLRKLSERMTRPQHPVPEHKPQLDKIVEFREPEHRVDLVTFLQYPQPGSFKRAA